MAALECDPDPRLAAASRLTGLLAAGAEMPAGELARLAAIDPDVTDLLDGIGDWPLRVQAIEVARELCTNAVA